MKIVHCCVSNYYADGYAYQENELVAQNIHDGHDVTVIASTETFDANQNITYLQPTTYIGTEGAKVIRLAYQARLPEFFKRKLRIHPAFFQTLVDIAPDVILFHGLSGWEILNVIKYKKEFPKTRFLIDSHEDFNNSARNFLSKYFLHYLYYRPIFKRCLPHVEKILCISIETMEFAKDFYGAPTSMVEFYPLGGHVIEDAEYYRIRYATRDAYGLDRTSLVFVQSGKMGKRKKLVEALRAFCSYEDRNAVYLVAGHVHVEIESEVNALAQSDSRVKILGWKNPAELRDLLCAADIYMQPGTQSVTMQMSICCRCAVLLDDVPSHKPFVNGNGWVLNKNFTLEQAFSVIKNRQGELPTMSARSARIASQLLDYRLLAARLYGCRGGLT